MALSLLCSLAFVTVLALMTALPGLRLSGWGLAMSSFFLVSLIPKIVDLLSDYTGGAAGFLDINDPVLFGYALSEDQFYVLVIASLMTWLALMRNLVVGRHGNALRVMRESTVLAGSLGYGTTRLKVTAYVLGAWPAGVAGWLFAYLDRYVAPNYFSFAFAIMIVAAAVLGGTETVYGAVFGVSVLQLGTGQIDAFADYTFIMYGVLLIAGGVLLTGKRYALLTERVRSFVTPTPVAVVGDRTDVPAVNGALLDVVDVKKSFGGVHALNGVTFSARPGQITGLIGANGSGKTTLLNIISGYYASDDGRLDFDGSALPRKRPQLSARRGISRTFQTPIIPRSMTVLDVVATSRYRREYAGILPAMLRLPSYRKTVTRDREEAMRWLAAVGVAHLAHQNASGLPLGSRRLVEVARALCAGSRLVLLDEPASGLDASEVAELSGLLTDLRSAGATIVLVEHNFEMVCNVADTIYVLERGQLIAHGSPSEIRSDEAVAHSYLGSSPVLDTVVEVASSAQQGDKP